MILHATSYTMVILFTIAVFIIFRLRRFGLYPFPPSDLDMNRSIADFSAFGQPTLSARLELRALPNARLVMAFGIVNSFTTTNRKIHTDFLKRANRVIRKMDDERWAELPQLAESVLDSTIAYLKTDQPHVPLAVLVRVSNFVLVLSVLFDIDPRAVDLRDAQTAAESINRLWLQSKSTQVAAEPEPEPEDRTLLCGALERLLPDQFPCEAPEHHPVNLIIPAFETLWRVVLLTFVAATSAAGVDAETTAQLADAAADIHSCFHSTGERKAMALSFAKEGLRLYPPTKRIKRGFVDNTSNTVGVMEADVEKCHRDGAIWGADVLRFRPSRFHPAALTRHMRRAYMPFGVGKHQCPAASGFGERIVAVLLLVLVRRFGVKAGAQRVRLDEKACEEQGSGRLLPSCRHEMEAWTIQV
ncbi:hypothetical protein F4775DRAFT_138160 [Biscogniauxia sp. FL1348]|nr:hypothetical protein F4775DRAFT_138160 [Biscogniauxia sp. FL1348]